MVAILDYGVGNMTSLVNAFNRLGYEAYKTANALDILEADWLVLPGVGEFSTAMQALNHLDLIRVLNKRKAQNKPIIGICLGMQVMFEASEESPGVSGLGWFKGTFSKFDQDLIIPHMGWNTLQEHGTDVYFVHSYYLSTYQIDDIVDFTTYGKTFPSLVKKEACLGFQFHPEKSGGVGLKVLKEWMTRMEKDNV